MDWLLLLHALLLGIVEGLTEFLPVSSTGHLIIVADFFNFTGERAKTFEIFIQLGSILGVMWFYRRRLTSLIARIDSGPTQQLLRNIAIAFLPAAILGLLLHRYIKEYLFNPTTVAVALVVGGIVILVIERLPLRARIRQMDEMSASDAFKVGCAQMLALCPGVSRSGATIMGGLVFGLSRTAATEFSFFLAMPTMLAATVYDLYKNIDLLSREDILLFAVGFVAAFITALIVVKMFLAYVVRHNFTPFAYYRIVLGTLVLIYFW